MLVARNGPLEGLLLHNLVALLVFHFGILVVGLHLYDLGGQKGRGKEGKRLSVLRPKWGDHPTRAEKRLVGAGTKAALDLSCPGLQEH